MGLTGMFLSHRGTIAKITFGRSDRESALSEENNELCETVSLMQDLLAMLEQIAIDPARQTADEIEKTHYEISKGASPWVN